MSYAYKYDTVNGKSSNYSSVSSDINSQFHFVESGDYKRNRVSQDQSSFGLKGRHGHVSNSTRGIFSPSTEYSNDPLKKFKWKYKCPNCHGNSSVYYCGECVKKGNFYHSSIKHPERYAEKRLRERQLRLYVSSLGQKALQETPLCLKKERLKRDIERLRERNELTKKVIFGELQKTYEADKELYKLQHQVNNLKKTVPKIKKKNAFLEETKQLYANHIAKKKIIILNSENEYKFLVRNEIRELTTYIFPLAEIEPESNYEDCESQSLLLMVKSLAEATQTHYVGGKWIRVANFTNHCNYSLLSTILPGSGEYASFALPQVDGERCPKKESQNICAGLSFLCQMINVIAHYLNIHLPKNISISDFSNFTKQEMEERKFHKLVSRMNMNVLYLCVAQGVPPSAIHPFDALPSLLSLLTDNEVDLGRFGNFDFPEVVVDRLEAIDRREDYPDSDSDSDWETVNASALPDIPSIPPLHRQTSLDDTASGIVTTAAASVLSILGFGNR